MRHGAGPERTREDHLDVAAQVYAGLSRARQTRELADLVGTAALSATDQAYLAFADAVNAGVIAQRAGEDRALEDTLNRAWSSLRALPRRELTMLSPRLIDRYLPPSDDSGGGR